MEEKKIAVAGAGYVGMAMGVLLAQNNPVSIVDPLPEKVNKINQKISPIVDQMPVSTSAGRRFPHRPHWMETRRIVKRPL